MIVTGAVVNMRQSNCGHYKQLKIAQSTAGFGIFNLNLAGAARQMHAWKVRATTFTCSSTFTSDLFARLCYSPVLLQFLEGDLLMLLLTPRRSDKKYKALTISDPTSIYHLGTAVTLHQEAMAPGNQALFYCTGCDAAEHGAGDGERLAPSKCSAVQFRIITEELNLAGAVQTVHRVQQQCTRPALEWMSCLCFDHFSVKHLLRGWFSLYCQLLGSALELTLPPASALASAAHLTSKGALSPPLYVLSHSMIKRNPRRRHPNASDRGRGCKPQGHRSSRDPILLLLVSAIVWLTYKWSC